MNSLIAILTISIFFILSGWRITFLLPNIHKVERLGLSFLIGSGITTLFWFVGYRLGLSLNLSTLGLSGMMVIVLSYLISNYLGIKPSKNQTIKLSRNELYLAITIIIFLIIAFAIGSYNPLTAWDSIALYDFRGHAIAINHDLRDIIDQSYYVSYPLFISLVHAATYMLGGISAQGIHAVFFASFIAVVFGRMKDWTNNLFGLITCFIIIGQNEIFSHANFAYTNLPYTVFLVSGLLYGTSTQMKNRISKYFILFSGIMIAMSTWMRSSEVFWILGVILIIWQGIRTKNKIISLISLMVIFITRYIWSNFAGGVLAAIDKAEPARINHFNLNSIQIIVSKWQEIANYLYQYIIDPYLGVWFLVIPILLIILMKRNIRLLMMFSTIIISACMVGVGVMVFSTYYETWNQIGDSARRMMLFVIPLAIITAMYALYIISEKDKNE